jgi:hypothetical protein
MALNTTMPQDIPKSSDTLADIPRDLLGPIPAEIRLGANVLMMMETPPDVGDVITVTMRLKIKRKAEDEGGEGGDERVHFRGAKIVAAWLKGDPEPPNADDDQPALFGDDGEATDDPEALGDVLDNVSRPSFSNGAGE